MLRNMMKADHTHSNGNTLTHLAQDYSLLRVWPLGSSGADIQVIYNEIWVMRNQVSCSLLLAWPGIADNRFILRWSSSWHAIWTCLDPQLFPNSSNLYSSLIVSLSSITVRVLHLNHFHLSEFYYSSSNALWLICVHLLLVRRILIQNLPYRVTSVVASLDTIVCHCMMLFIIHNMASRCP
jgi:hypothetical protein